MTATRFYTDTQGKAPPEHKLAIWAPKGTLSLAHAHRHTRFVRRLRLVLIGLSVSLLAALAWFFLSVPKTALPVENTGETVKMIHPVYQGRTSDGLPYRIIADEAVRLIKAPTQTQLVSPILNFLREKGAKESRITARTGSYNAETQVLELHQNVHLKTDDGNDCRTSHARIFVKAKRVEGDEPIRCTGSFGKIFGNAFEINDDYKEFVFKDGTKMHLTPESERDGKTKTGKLRPAQSPDVQKSGVQQ